MPGQDHLRIGPTGHEIPVWWSGGEVCGGKRFFLARKRKFMGVLFKKGKIKMIWWCRSRGLVKVENVR